MISKASGMDCRQVRGLLPLYADGNLDGAREAQVAAHLAGCPACRERAGLDRELAARLAAFTPAANLAARRGALRSKVMGRVDKERRWQPWRRTALRLGNAATWVTVSAVTVALVLAIAVTWRPLAERAWGHQALGTTPAGLDVLPERLVLYQSGQAGVVEPGMGVFAPLAAEVEQVLELALTEVGRDDLTGPDAAAQEAERIKAQQVAIEAVYPAPGVSPGGHGPYTTALIRLDATPGVDGLQVLLGGDRYTRALSGEAGQALDGLRRILGVPQPAGEALQFGAARDLFTPPPSAGFYRVSPDGRWVLYPVPGGHTAGGDTIEPHLEVYDTLSGETTTVKIAAAEGNGAFEGQYVWLSGGRQLLVRLSGHRGQILFKALRPEPTRTLLEVRQGSVGFGDVAISPDGWRIAYTVLYPDGPAPVPKAGIEVMDVDGSGRRQIVEPDYFIDRLAWTPDGSQLVYFKGEGGTPPEDGEAYVVGADNAPAPALPQPVMDGARPVAWSPDGTRVLWLSEPPGPQGRADLTLTAWPLAARPAAGEVQLVARGVGVAGAAWAGSNEWFIYSQDGALYLASATGAGQPRRLTPEDEWAGAPVWVPGKGLVYEVARDGFATLRLLPLAEAGGEPGEQDTAGLTVEEHAVATEATGFPAGVEGTGWIDPEILGVRRAWREPGPAERVAATNEALRPFGYRLEPRIEEKSGYLFYDLYQGDRVVMADLMTVWPVSVSAAGDDFALVVEQFNGPYLLIRPVGSEKWDGSQHQYQPPVFVGHDLVTATGMAALRSVTVLQGRKPVYTSFFVDWPPASYPIKGLWSWRDHWVLEVSGRVLIDGKDLNRQLGYDEIFGYRLLDGQPFYFFKQGGRVGVSYDGITLPQQYEEVRHYGCCSAAAYNPGGNDTMVWFFGLRDGTWYYVEMGRYGTEETSNPDGR